MIFSEKIALKALNAAKRTSPISYIGLRILLDDKNNKSILNWLESYVQRKLLTSSNFGYMNFKWFKKINENSTLDHREFYIGSPTTLLIEAYILSLLSEQECFKNHIANYSYNLASSYQNTNYKYYYERYLERNERIGTCLWLLNAATKSNDAKAFIFDLKNYYPSLDKNEILDKFVFILSKCGLDEKIKSGIKKYVENYLRISESGLPVNPDIGHILGSIMLSDMDEELSKKFQHRYFRYVDDIVVVGLDAEEQEIIDSIKNYRPTNTDLNTDKFLILDDKKWALLTENKKEDDNLFELQKDISIFFSAQDDIGALKKLFDENSIGLPLYKLYANSRYRPYQHFIKKITNNLTKYMRGLNEAKILSRALILRDKYENELIALLAESDAGCDIKNKKLTKQRRQLLGRLIYLYSPKEYERLLKYIPNSGEFTEILALVNSFIKNDVSEVLRLGTKTVLAYCDIWKSNVSQKPKFNKELLETEQQAAIEGLAIMTLYGVLNIEDYIDLNNIRKDNLQKYLLCCSVNKIDKRIMDDLSYFDEFLSLRIGLNSTDLRELLFSRYASGDRLKMHALDLDEADYYS